MLRRQKSKAPQSKWAKSILFQETAFRPSDAEACSAVIHFDMVFSKD